MIMMLSRVELRNRYDFRNPFSTSKYYVLTYHFRGTNSYSTNILQTYGSLVIPKLGDCKVIKTHSGFLIEKHIPRYQAPFINDWNVLMRQLEIDLNNIVSQQ
ncbi:MAG: hypothetical protein L0Y68_07100 [Candidatus Dadabacteria bacterium]|nr:hypothetical protein [Candidatus Dadabacteria bacterium]